MRIFTPIVGSCCVAAYRAATSLAKKVLDLFLGLFKQVSKSLDFAGKLIHLGLT
jgi:hypothetical protein